MVHICLLYYYLMLRLAFSLFQSKLVKSKTDFLKRGASLIKSFTKMTEDERKELIKQVSKIWLHECQSPNKRTKMQMKCIFDRHLKQNNIFKTNWRRAMKKLKNRAKSLTDFSSKSMPVLYSWKEKKMYSKERKWEHTH